MVRIYSSYIHAVYSTQSITAYKCWMSIHLEEDAFPHYEIL